MSTGAEGREARTCSSRTNLRVISTDSHEKAHAVTRADLVAFLGARLTSDDHLHTAVTVANL